MVLEGYVISQSPLGGKAEKNTKISLVISKGEDPASYVTLSDYTGMDIYDVVSELESKGLEVTY